MSTSDWVDLVPTSPKDTLEFVLLYPCPPKVIRSLPAEWRDQRGHRLGEFVRGERLGCYCLGVLERGTKRLVFWVPWTAEVLPEGQIAPKPIPIVSEGPNEEVARLGAQGNGAPLNRFAARAHLGPVLPLKVPVESWASAKPAVRYLASRAMGLALQGPNADPDQYRTPELPFIAIVENAHGNLRSALKHKRPRYLPPGRYFVTESDRPHLPDLGITARPDSWLTQALSRLRGVCR